MKNSLKLMLAGAALVVSMGVSVAHAKTLDVVRDSNGTPVHAESGDCLRTKWEAPCDNCNIKKTIRETRSVYFGFGKSALTTEGKKTLDVLVASLKDKGAVVSVRVAGFADRVGNHAANEKLSKKRADKVRQYLVSKGLVNAQVVETRWFGDSVPATQCPKKLSKAKLIKCLQPDRRVDVEIDLNPAK